MLTALYARRKKKIGRGEGRITAGSSESRGRGIVDPSTIQPATERKGVFPRHNGGRLTELDVLKANLEEDRTHLIEQVSALQTVQLEHEKAIEKAGRDQEEHTTIIVCDVPMRRMVLTIL